MSTKTTQKRANSVKRVHSALLDVRAMITRTLVALVACAGCGASPEEPTVDAAPLVDAAPPSGFPPMLTIGASHGTLASSFQATIAGSGSGSLGTIAIDSNTGTTQLDGEIGQTALYNSVPFSGYTIFGSVVIAPDRWSIAYPYCMGSSLVDVYAETVGAGGFVLSPASGSCASVTSTAPTAVDLPGFTIATPAAFGSAVVHGAQIELDHGAGQIALAGVMKPAVVFNTVDCSTTCGTPGWYELHTLIWDETAQAATFVIIYLTVGAQSHVQLSYALRLPALDDPFHDAVLSATWTGTAARTLELEPVHLPPPWRISARP